MSETQPNPAADTPNAGEGTAAQPAPAAHPEPAKAAEAPKPNEGQPPAPQPAAPVVPEKYELKPPEGSLVGPAQLEKIAQYAKEQGFSQEQAQKYLERESAVLADFQQGQQEGLKTQSQAWVEDIKADKELGGPKFQENMEHAFRAFERFASPEFVKVMKDTGLGNHPEMVRTFFKISQAMKDDSLILAPTHDGSAKTAAELLYGGTRT